MDVRPVLFFRCNSVAIKQKRNKGEVHLKWRFPCFLDFSFFWPFLLLSSPAAVTRTLATPLAKKSTTTTTTKAKITTTSKSFS